MSRLIFPEDFQSQEQLLRNVVDKNNSFPPATSPIAAFLAQHSIVLADDETAADAALAFERDRKAKAGEAEYKTQQRNLAFDPVFANVRSYYQYLKKFYSPAFMELALWGAPITVSGRIAYPNEFIERVNIFFQFKTKYDSYAPAPNPLDAYLTQHDLSITTNATAVTNAFNLHNESKALAGAAEDATQDRNNVWNPVMDHLRAIGGFLMSLYDTNPKELNLWGFNVDDSPRAPKEVKSKIKLSSQITFNSLVIGGTLKNIGPVSLLVYKGNAATGPSVNVLPGEMYGIAKGFNTITVVNPSNTTTGIISTLRYR